MSALATAPFVLVAVPVTGALVGLGLLNRPLTLRIWVLLTTMASLGSVGWSVGQGPRPAALPSLVLLPLMAFLTLLGQPAHRRLASAWLLTLLFLALSLGVVAFAGPVSPLCYLGLLAVIGLALLHYRRGADYLLWPDLATIALGGVAVGLGIATGQPLSPAFVLAGAVALPLLPFHRGYLGAVTTLPGNLPAFLALGLPLVGLHLVVPNLPHLPAALQDLVAGLAVAGSLYGSLRALVQVRPASVIGYGGVALLSIAWWNVSASGTASSAALLYVCAVGSASGGLLSASFALRARYGEIGLRATSGLAPSMPRLAVVLSLLALAGLGFPPFGVFAGFLGMLLAPSFAWSGAFLLIVAAWLAASWYTFEFVQGLLFGPPRGSGPPEDLHDPEFAALALTLVLLLTLGLLPSEVFDAGQPGRTVVMSESSWKP
jgi:NADH-quinone oxidoreductase subunit M